MRSVVGGFVGGFATAVLIGAAALYAVARKMRRYLGV